ncbi:hypothetical protein R3P38DRAFT_2774366 [Favolaschia claudopus]|uniref:Uncharacterized protein n=1 Tax=Favolaschia claudopus TaxID=2862362 RepID=A0AAW0BZZ6_9AGAR
MYDTATKEFPAQTGHYRVGKNFYTTFLGTREMILDTPSAKAAPCPTPWDRNPDFLTPTYMSARYPFHAFIPKHDPWQGPLLGCLSYSFRSLPIIQREDGTWSLHQDAIHLWQDLELCLRGVGREMLFLSTNPFPKEGFEWLVSHRFNYSAHYKTEKGARLAAWRSKQKFLPLLGLVSMGFWYMMHDETEDENEKYEGEERSGAGSKRKASDIPASRPTKRVKTNKGNAPPQLNVPWRQALAEKLKLQPSWLDLLEDSIAADFRVPRVGALVDLQPADLDDADRPLAFSKSDTGLEWLIPSILRKTSPIPLYFSWGPLHRSVNFAVPEYLSRLGLVPAPDQIQYLKEAQIAFTPFEYNVPSRAFLPKRKSSASRSGVLPQSDLPSTSVSRKDTGASQLAAPSPKSLPTRTSAGPNTPSTSSHAGPNMPSTHSTDAAPPSSLDNFPPVHRNSGQRHQELMEDFFQRRERENSRKSATENPADKTARMQREQNAQRGQAPGKKGACVFVWEKEDNSVFYIRRPGGRKSYEDLFETYGASQRRYDSFRDEWDLCSAFGDDRGVDDDVGGDQYGDYDDDEMDEYERGFQTAVGAPLSQKAEPLPLAEVGPASERNLQRIYLHFGPSKADEEGQVDPPRYRAIAEDLTTSLLKRFGFMMGESLSNPARTPEASIVASLVGMEDIDAQFAGVMATFFGQFLEAKSIAGIDSTIFDFHQRRGPLFQDRAVVVRRETLTNVAEETSAVYYTLSDHGSGYGSQVLLLQKAADVLEVLRQGWGPRVKDVAGELLSRGMPFRLAVKDSADLVRQRAKVIPGYCRVNVDSGLGFRPQHYEPNIHDYHAYLSRLNSELLHTRRGHVAPLYGGVIGRIAREEVCDEHVLQGPSDDVYDDGACLWDGQSDHAYWYETLSEHEIDVICGVYYVATGKKLEAGEEQTKLLSWWPKPNAWQKGNLDPGWWSPACEGWYQKRRLRLGDANRYGEKGMLARPNEWKHNLRFVKTLKDIVQAHERISSLVLDELL